MKLQELLKDPQHKSLKKVAARVRKAGIDAKKREMVQHRIGKKTDWFGGQAAGE